MISSISNVKFCGDVPNTSSQDLINSPGKFTTAAAPMANADQPADTFESPKKKSNTGKVIGGVIAVLAAVWIGLGVAVGKGKMTKAIAEEGKNLTFGEKAKNIAYEIGVSAKKCWDAVFNRSRKAADEVADAADDAGKGKKPATDKPATDKPATDKPATDKPATDKPATDKPATDKPATDKPATDKPATDKPATDKPADKRTRTKKTETETPAAPTESAK